MSSLTPIFGRPRGVRVAALVLALAAALGPLALSTAAPQGAEAAEPAGVSLRPADAAGAFDGRTNFHYKGDPGQALQDYAAVVNTGTETNVFTIIGTDAFNDSKGDFAVLPTANKPTAVGRWITFDNGTNRMTMTLAPGEGHLVAFKVKMPANARPGDHVGGLVASVLSTQGQVQVDHRVAIRLYARVSGDLQPSLTITSLAATYTGDWWNLTSGSVKVRYTVTNPGNVALAANVVGGVNTWFGIPLKTVSSSGVQEILPGNSAAYSLELSGIARWLYLAPYLHVKPFVDGSDVASYVLAPPSSRDAVLLVVPWVVLIGLALLAVIVTLVVWRRREQNRRAIIWMEDTEKRVREQALAENAGELQETSSRRD